MNRNWLCLALVAAGCTADIRRADLFVAAVKEQKAGNWQTCAERFTESLKILERESSLAGGQAQATALGFEAGSLGGRAPCLNALGRNEEARADYAGCVEKAGRALELTKALPPTRDRTEAWGRSLALAGNHSTRSLCYKDTGRLPEAIADLEAQIAHSQTACANPPAMLPKSIREPACNQVADLNENLARWKKGRLQ